MIEVHRGQSIGEDIAVTAPLTRGKRFMFGEINRQLVRKHRHAQLQNTELRTYYKSHIQTKTHIHIVYGTVLGPLPAKAVLYTEA